MPQPAYISPHSSREKKERKKRKESSAPTHLRQQVPGRVAHVIIGKSRHGEITVVVAVLPPHVHFAFACGRFDQVFGEQLALMVEVVACALFCVILAMKFFSFQVGC